MPADPSPAPAPGLLDLPDPLLDRVLELVGFRGAAGAAAACRALADAAARAVWPGIDLWGDGSEGEARRLARHARAGRVAGFRCVNAMGGAAALELAAALFPRSSPTSLALGGPLTAGDLLSLLRLASGTPGAALEDLYAFPGERERVHVDGPAAPLPRVPSLRSLHASAGGGGAGWIPLAFPNLVRLVLHADAPGRAPDVAALAPLASLESLEVRRAPGGGVPGPGRGAVAALLAGPAGRSLRRLALDGAELGAEDIDAVSAAPRLEELRGVELALDPSLPHERLARAPALAVLEASAVEGPSEYAGGAPWRIAAALEGRRVASLEIRTADGRAAARILLARGARSVGSLSFPCGSDACGALEALASGSACPGLASLQHAPPFPPGAEAALGTLAARGVRLWISAEVGSRIGEAARAWRGPGGGPAAVVVTLYPAPIPWAAVAPLPAPSP